MRTTGRRRETSTRTSYADLLPGLSAYEFEALSADIKLNGVRVPIDVDEDGVILDGHHRFKVDKAAPRRVIKGLTDAEKRAHVYRANFARRNLSGDQRRDLQKAMKELAKALRDEDAK